MNGLPGPPRLLYVVNQYPELSQTFVTEEVRWVRDAGVDVVIASVRAVDRPGRPVPGVLHLRVCPDRPSLARSINALLQGLMRRPVGTLRTVAAAVAAWIPGRRMDLVQALEILTRLEATPDRIHAHFAMRGASVGSLVAAGLGVPFSFTAHAIDIFVFERDVARLHAAADVQVAVCEYNASYQRSKWPEVADPVVIPCGVDVSRFAARTEAPDNGPVLAVARLVEKKGLAHLVDAVGHLRDRGLQVRCVIVGEGPERSALEQQARDRGLESLVEFVGALPHDEVRHLMAEATVLVMPSVVAESGDRDSQPVVVKEAMACGVPCVVTDEVGLPEVVTAESGWIVPPRDSNALADAISQAVREPQPARQARAAAARRRAEDFAFDRTIPRLLATLDLTAGSVSSPHTEIAATGQADHHP